MDVGELHNINRTITPKRIPVVLSQNEVAKTVDIVIVEGAGASASGWMVPINEKETMANLAVTLDLPVISVIGIRLLGCLNHALLTTQGIATSGLKHCGWIANYLPQTVRRMFMR